MNAPPVPRFVAVRRKVRRWIPQPSPVVVYSPPPPAVDRRRLVRAGLVFAALLLLFALMCAWLFSRAPLPDLNLPGLVVT